MPEGGGLSEAEQEFWSLRAGFYSDFDYLRPGAYTQPRIDVPVGSIYDIVAAGISARQGVPVPEIFPTVEYSDSGVSAPAPSGDDAVLPPVIDPEAETTTTVFEDEVSSDYQLPSRPTDWGEYYDRYVILNPEIPSDLPPPIIIAPGPTIPVPGTVDTPPEEVDPVDWGDINWGGVAEAIFPIPTAAMDLYRGYQGTQNLVAGPAPVAGPPAPTGGVMQGGNGCASACPPSGPKYAKVCLATGAVMPLRQRRRRRLLTSGDLSDLAALKALFGNSAGVQAALVKAVRR